MGSSLTHEPTAKELLASEDGVAAAAPVLAGIARWERAMAREPEVRLQFSEEMPFHLDPAVWGTGFARVEPKDMWDFQPLREVMRHRTPQALLRDLHRVVRPTLRYHNVPVRGVERDPAGVAALADAKRAQQREKFAPLTTSLAALKTVVRERRQWLATPWKPHYRDDEVHPPVEVMRWGD